VRRIIIPIALVFLALGLVPGASSAPPTRELLPPLGEYTSTACGFPVVLETVHERFLIKTYTEGHTLVESLTGTGVIRLTSENASFTVNVSGPSFVRQHRDGSLSFEGAGNWLFYDHPFTNLAPLAYTTGHITFGEDTVSPAGRIVDLCARLD
jgi:hypothetical protein